MNDVMLGPRTEKEHMFFDPDWQALYSLRYARQQVIDTAYQPDKPGAKTPDGQRRFYAERVTKGALLSLFPENISKQEKMDGIKQAFFLSTYLRLPGGVDEPHVYADEDAPLIEWDAMRENDRRVSARKKFIISSLISTFSGVTLLRAFVLTFGYELERVLTLSTSEVEVYYRLALEASPAQLSWEALSKFSAAGVDGSLALALLDGGGNVDRSHVSE